MQPLREIELRGNVLPTVMVVAALMMLTVLAVMSLWEMDTQLFVRNSHIKARRADLASAFVIYEELPGIYSEDKPFTVFKEDPLSEVAFERRPWGIYEVMTAASVHAGIRESAIIGLRPDSGTGLYYADNNSSLTLTGNTNIHGTLHGPKNGIIYGQMKSVFFNGERLPQNRIKTAGKTLPVPASPPKKEVAALLELSAHTGYPQPPDSLSVSFAGDSTAVFNIPCGLMEFYTLSGNIVLVGDKIKIGASNAFGDILVAGRSITIEKGFRGTLQVFARDSLVLENDVRLEYPSGLYSGNYMEIAGGSVVGGYAIVCARDKDIRKPNYKQARTAKVRGFLYVDGNAQLQGIVSGPAYLSRTVYYSAEGYYKDILYDASVLGNEEMALPLWLSAEDKRKKIKTVR